MNDTELDELLNQWDAPPVRAELRESVRAGFAAGRKRRRIGFVHWIAAHLPRPTKGLVAGAVVGAAVFFFVVTQAFPHVGAPAVHIPWTVDSEFIRYADDGSSSVEMYMTSYKLNNSNEILLSRSAPGNIFVTALGRTLDVVGPALSRLTLPFVVDSKTLERLKKMQSEHPGVGVISGCDAGCLMLNRFGFAAGNRCLAGEIVGRETILNHPAEAVRKRWMERGRMTVWTAPDLECFALRVTYEAQQPDGSFHLVRAKQAVKITVNP